MKFAAAVVGTIMFIGAIAAGTWGCREAQINSCEDRGGQALTREWWMGDWHDVRCVEPGEDR